MTVGFATDTEDLSGEVIERAEEVNLSREQVERVIEGFIGEIQQVPPMYSAVGVAGGCMSWPEKAWRWSVRCAPCRSIAFSSKLYTPKRSIRA